MNAPIDHSCVQEDWLRSPEGPRQWPRPRDAGVADQGLRPSNGYSNFGLSVDENS